MSLVSNRNYFEYNSSSPFKRRPKDIGYPRKPDPWRPHPRKPDPWRPHPRKPDPWRPHPGKPDPWRPHPGKPDPWRPHPGKPDPWRPHPGKPSPWRPHPREAGSRRFKGTTKLRFRGATEEPPSGETISMAPPSLGLTSRETPSREPASPIPVLGIRKPGLWKPSQQCHVQYKYPDVILSAERLFHCTCF
ncbi:hypothetical protein B0T14DRAFT_86194 [Immersiella caudata]|uniref:Uncharacterized protein n=1 Tax=Immersiella caudata TaxID=314043 RepID=A0AA39XHG2_9PEZI|nr:hypothetical protein B0T14DRAFT_86194 [Immersiella caudata]